MPSHGDYDHMDEAINLVNKFKKGNYNLEFLNTKIYDNENDSSSVIYLNYNDYKFLFMGDAGIGREKDILDKYNLSDIDVLKVGHHGSNTSSSEEFLNQVKPKYSIIMVGKNNSYKLPKSETIEKLNKIGSQIYRTDENGTIQVTSDGNDIEIKKYNN